MSVVLDASALLAWLREEPGSEIVEPLLGDSVMSTVNWAEVVQKALAYEIDIDGLQQDMSALGLDLQPFSAEHAERAGRLWPRTRAHGLSLGDRACLGLGQVLNTPILTSDKQWQALDLPLDIRVIR